MQLKSLFYVASALAVAIARATISDIVAGITTIDARVNTLQQGVADIPQTGGSMAAAIVCFLNNFSFIPIPTFVFQDVHNRATATIDAIQDATATAKVSFLFAWFTPCTRP
jgi:hypothetical protein